MVLVESVEMSQVELMISILMTNNGDFSECIK